MFCFVRFYLWNGFPCKIMFLSCNILHRTFTKPLFFTRYTRCIRFYTWMTEVTRLKQNLEILITFSLNNLVFNLKKIFVIINLLGRLIYSLIFLLFYYSIFIIISILTIISSNIKLINYQIY